MKNHNFWFLVLLLVFLLAAALFWLAGKESANLPGTFREPTSEPFVTPPPGPPSAATGFTPPTTLPPGTPETSLVPVNPFDNYQNPFQQ